MQKDDTIPEQAAAPRVYKVLLMVLPVGVVLGTIVFMFMYFYLEREEEKKHSVIVSHGLRLSDLVDMVNKFTDRIGERDIETEQGRVGLRRAASMIEGRMGQQNVGYPVRRCEGTPAYGLLWKSLSVEIEGSERPGEVVLVAASYSGAGEVADANPVSTLMLLASAMAREKPDRTLRFVFLPMDDSDDEQNRWLLKRCLQAGETCVGILGLKTMTKPPATGEPEWLVSTSNADDKAWWDSLKGGQPIQKHSGNVPPAVWLTHPVFSSSTWTGDLDGRMARTIDVARQVRNWLRTAVSE